MRAHFFTALLLPIIYAQDDVQVDCTPDHMEIRVTKGNKESTHVKIDIRYVVHVTKPN